MLTRENKIDDQDTSTSSAAWHALMWNYCVNATLDLKNSLLQIPSLFFPNNPGGKNILAWIGLSGWPAEILKAIGPIGLFFQWKNTVNSFVKLGEADNRNFVRYKEAAISLLTSFSWTFILIATLASATALLIKTVPYILTALFCLGTVNSLVNCGLNIYYAVTASTKALRNEYLVKAAKDFLSLVTNALAFVVSFYLNIKVLNAANLLNDNFISAITTIGDAFVTSANVLTALTISTALSLSMATQELNLSTWKAISNPRETWNNIKETLSHNPLTIVPMMINFAVRTLALALAPLQLIFHGVTKFVKSKVSEKEPVAPSAPAEDKILEIRTNIKIALLEKQLGKEQKTILDSAHFKTLPEITKRRIAKKDLLVSLQERKKPAEQVISEIKKQQRSVFYSFWQPRKGEVQRIADEYINAEKALVK